MPSDDKKPSSRFDMIAAEMTTEPEMTVVEDLRPVWNGEAVTCPQCGNSAFEPLVPSGRVPRVACLGCPAPAPTFILAEGVKLSTNRYRCGRCGNQPQVTMTLSEVNLYCRRCTQLTLHARQVDGDAARRARTESVQRVRLPSLGELEGEGEGDAEPKTGGLTRELSRQGFFEDSASAPLPRDPTVAMVVAMVMEKMRATLGLFDFTAFAEGARKANVEANLRAEDLGRRTGRTTRGLLEALARCSLKQARVLFVCGLSPTHEKELRYTVAELRDRLKLDYPTKIQSMPSDPNPAIFDARIGLQVYVDHSYWDGGRRRPNRTLDNILIESNSDRAALVSANGRVVGAAEITAVFGDLVVGLVREFDIRRLTARPGPSFAASFKLVSTWTPQLQDRLTLAMVAANLVKDFAVKENIYVTIISLRRIATSEQTRIHDIDAFIDNLPGAVAGVLRLAGK